VGYPSRVSRKGKAGPLEAGRGKYSPPANPERVTLEALSEGTRGFSRKNISQRRRASFFEASRKKPTLSEGTIVFTNEKPISMKDQSVTKNRVSISRYSAKSKNSKFRYFIKRNREFHCWIFLSYQWIGTTSFFLRGLSLHWYPLNSESKVLKIFSIS
jgi:hypothetical protein